MDGIDLSAGSSPSTAPSRCAPRRSARFAATFAPHGFAPDSDATRPTAWPRRRSWSQPAGAAPGRSCARSAATGCAVIAPLPPRDDADDAQTVVGCGRALAGERIAIVDPDEPPAARRRPDRRNLGRRPQCRRAAIGAMPKASAAVFGARIAGEDDQRDHVAAHRRSRLSRRGGRVVHHRPHQGGRHHPRRQPLSAGHRGYRAELRPGAAPAWRRGVHRHRRTATRRNWSRPGGRAHLIATAIAVDEIVGRIREAIVSEHEIVPHRDHAAAARGLAEDHQRQDPAGAEPAILAGGIARPAVRRSSADCFAALA